MSSTERSELERATYIVWEDRALSGWQPTAFTDAAELTRCIQNGNVAGGWPFVITGPPLSLEIVPHEPAVSPTANSYSELDRLRAELAATATMLEWARAALAKYGDHLPSCPRRWHSAEKVECDCGLDAVLADLGASDE